jgi:hypothetical protein
MAHPLAASPCIPFAKGAVMSRFSYHDEKASNNPHWNPHAQYEPVHRLLFEPDLTSCCLPNNVFIHACVGV